MGDTTPTELSRPIYFGAGFGPARFRRESELSPYNTEYFETNLHLGIEPMDLFELPLFWQVKLASSLIFDGSFYYTGGDEINLGSHRMMLTGQGGLRNRFFLFNRFAIFLDLMALAGGSYNELNFGKGFPLPEDWTGNAGAVARLGLEFCIGSNVCVAPNLSAEFDFSIGDPSYSHTSAFLNLDIFFGLFDKEEPECEPPPPPPPCPDCEECKVCPEPPACPDPYEIPSMIMFPNDNPDITLQPQWFADNDYQMHECWSNPTLDHFIRIIDTWAKKTARTGNQYTIEVHVRGFANETGEDDRQRRLALERSAAVTQYLLAASDGVMYQSGLGSVSPPESSLRYEQIADEANIPASSGIETIEHKICGTTSVDGKDMINLPGPTGLVSVIDDTAILYSQNPAFDPQEQRVSSLLQESTEEGYKAPYYRVVILDIVVKDKAGNTVNTEEFRKIMDALEVPKVKKE